MAGPDAVRPEPPQRRLTGVATPVGSVPDAIRWPAPSPYTRSVHLTRRGFVAGAAAALVGPSLWADVVSGAVDPVRSSASLGPPDDDGLRLPAGFSGRVVARSGRPVGTTGFVWHEAPDGGGVLGRSDGGWSYVSNSEFDDAGGSVSVVEFDRTGRIAGAFSIASGTSRNCSGGMTPWGTWLTCEETPFGRVYECDPSRADSAVARPALGAFRHEAAVVDPVTGDVHLTEDRPDGRLYRFVPDVPGRLDAGRLQAASVAGDASELRPGESVGVTWVDTSADRPDRSPSTSPFDGGEGAWVDGDRLLFTTKGDRRVWSLGLRTDRLGVLHDCLARPDTPLDAVDNITVHPATGDVYVAEDGGNMELVTLRQLPDGELEIVTFLRVVGQDDSEITGPAFSPDGSRLYVSSQRGTDGRGITYEVTGPFGRPPTGAGVVVASTVGLARARRLGA